MPVKSKAAKGRADAVDADEAREVLQTLECGAPPPPETLLKVFRLNMGPCSASCGKGGKGSKDNPCCFHGLLPAEGSFRKKGLWQKEPVLGQLGFDPADDKRMVRHAAVLCHHRQVAAGMDLGTDAASADWHE
jgi:ubiquitin carboxyl-terminal hydrolase 48